MTVVIDGLGKTGTVRNGGTHLFHHWDGVGL